MFSAPGIIYTPLHLLSLTDANPSQISTTYRMGRVDDPVAAALQPLSAAQQAPEEGEDDDEVEVMVVKKSRPSSSFAATTDGETAAAAAAATEKDAAAAGQPPQPQSQQQRRLKRREEKRKQKKRPQRVRVTLPLGAADDEVIPSMAELAARKGLAWTGAGEGMAGSKKAKQKRKCVVGIFCGVWCLGVCVCPREVAVSLNDRTIRPPTTPSQEEEGRRSVVRGGRERRRRAPRDVCGARRGRERR